MPWEPSNRRFCLPEVGENFDRSRGIAWGARDHILPGGMLLTNKLPQARSLYGWNEPRPDMA